jgi:arginyl-tRNA synthetase
MPFFELKKQLAVKISQELKLPEVTPEWLEAEFNTPPNVQLGHVALPCFRLAKLLKMPSDKIAKDLTSKIQGAEFSSVPTGPYANFRFNLVSLYDSALSAIFKKKERYGSDSGGNGKKVVLEYCSPNIAKKLAFQHIRSTLIGNTLANVYEFLGYDTKRLNFVGDWGTQFARLMAGVEQWGDKSKISDPNLSAAMDSLFEAYIRFHKEIETNPQHLELSSRCLQRLEEQDPKAIELWKDIRKISLATMDLTLKRMNIKFDLVEGESQYISEIKKTLDEIKKKTDAKLSEGAWIVEVPNLTTPALIQKRDGTTLYLTRDIAAAIDRFQRIHFDHMFYVVSEQQRLHFQLLFGVLKKMGYDWSERCEHISFGTVLFGSEKMSTREGRVIFLDDLLNEAHARALVTCTQKNPDLPNKEEVAEQVGIGAVIFGELSSHRQRDIEFNWEQILALDGETGPYVQYSLVRCRSLLAKAKEKGEVAERIRVDGYEFSQEEEVLLLALAKFRSNLMGVIRDNEPFHLTHYLVDLAKAFNRFYYQLPVLQATDPRQRKLRLSLVAGAEQTLLNGLSLLGIRSPQEM